MKQLTSLAATAIFLVMTTASPAISNQTEPESSNATASNGFKPIRKKDWGKPQVRKVLHAFAFGGFASDAQIRKWSEMPPRKAIKQMLNFKIVNRELSKPEAWINGQNGTLADLQDLWGSNVGANPVRRDRYHEYTFLNDERTGVRGWVLPYVWVQATNTRGVNPFLHKVALYLTNYHMAISLENAGAGLMRQYYDDFIIGLNKGKTFTQLQYIGARSAAVANAYGHQYNAIWNGEFHGNDDFAREFHQLFFRIQGETEDREYHENVTIENTARVLTGMRVDLDPNAYGIQSGWGSYVGPIRFTDHNDPAGRFLQNRRTHKKACLEVLNDGATGSERKNICGANASEKLKRLVNVASRHPEAKANIPVKIIRFFGDDNLNKRKIQQIRAEWKSMKQKDLLNFLREYAISRIFHQPNTFKYRNSFDRVLIAKNMNTLSNEESFARHVRADWRLNNQQARIFSPIANVFGGQTGQQAASNQSLFRRAYADNVNSPWYFNDVDVDRTPENGLPRDWVKNWAKTMPGPENLRRRVKNVGEWLWKRFTGDRGDNFELLARAQVFSILATGRDFGYRAYEAGYISDMNQILTADDIRSNPDLVALHNSHKKTKMVLNDRRLDVRKLWNRRVGTAVNFITATPFMFALEGK
ncbi:MAG: DUF1800 family protein [Pseudomonadota bacterium]